MTVESNVARVSVPFPESAPRHLGLAIGACKLRIAPGEERQNLVAGTFRDPSGGSPPEVTRNGGTVRIAMRPEASRFFKFFDGVPTLDLALGDSAPFALTVEGGATESVVNLGGLPIERLSIKHGANKMDVDFAAPNPVEMSLLEVGTGAAAIELRNLANANAAEMRFDGGACSYMLNFGGTLRRDTNVRVSTGMASVEIYIPTGVAASVKPETVLGGLDIGDGWTKQEGSYMSSAALSGGTPRLTISATVALGSLKLRLI